MGNISINRKSGITWQIICFASLSYCCFFFVVVFPIVRPSAISQDSWSSAHSFVTSIFIPDPYYILSISASLTCTYVFDFLFRGQQLAPLLFSSPCILYFFAVELLCRSSSSIWPKSFQCRWPFAPMEGGADFRMKTSGETQIAVLDKMSVKK